MSEQQIEDEKLYTTKEVAALAGLKDDGNIRRLLIAGRIDGQKIGRQWLVTGAAVRRWLSEREQR